MKSSFNQFIQKTYDGRVIDPSYVRFRGMKSIVINVASECGYTDTNYKDIFEIGSITKVFTANILAKSVIDNKIKLNENITDYLDIKFKNNFSYNHFDL